MKKLVIAVALGFGVAIGFGVAAPAQAEESPCMKCKLRCQENLHQCIADKKQGCSKKAAECLESCKATSGCP